MNRILMNRILLSDRITQELLDALEKRIEKADRDINSYLENWHLALRFIESKQIARDFVEFVYENEPGIAKSAVESFHDEHIDLTTIPCAATDFKPWSDHERAYQRE